MPAVQIVATIVYYLLLIYFVIAFVITRLMRGLEKRLKAGIGKDPGSEQSAREVKRAQTTGVGGVA